MRRDTGDAAASSIIGLYRRHAAAWDKARGTRLIERGWLDRFATLLPAGGRILDIGCGTGDPIAWHLASRGFRIVGVDSAPEMVALFRVHLSAATAHVADMRQLDLGDTFDGLIAWDSFFHLAPDDQRAMIPIFRNHAAPGAALMFTSGLARGEAIGTLEGEPLYHASLGPGEYRELLGGCGFEVVRHVAEDPDCGGHTVWLARRR